MSRPLLPQVPPYLNAVPNPANVVQLTAAPTSAYVDQPLGTIGLFNGAAYLLTAKTSSTATWILLESSGGAGVFTTLSSTGLTNLNTTGTAATNIGVSGSTTTVLGTVNVNATGAGVTTIGTGGTGAVNIGNATGNTAVTGTLTSSADITATTGAITATAGGVVAGTTVTAGTGITATTGDIKASAGEVIAGGDTGGVASTIALTNANSSTISTGVGSVKMSTANAATNTAWLKIYIGTNAFWIPAWTTNAP